MRIALTKTFTFDSAHWLPTFPEGHKCRRLHGHSYYVDVVVAGEIDPEAGYLVDYGDIKKAVGPIIDQLDHRLLNEIEGLENPTAEMLCVYLYGRIKPLLPLLDRIRVRETCTSEAEYAGPDV